MQTIKLVTVGDVGVGKTSLLIRYANNSFSEEYVPTVFDNYIINLNVDEISIELELQDTPDPDEYYGERVRPSPYINSNVIIIAFSVVNRSSFENVTSKWIPKMNHFFFNGVPPIVLVGTKCDLRDNDQQINPHEVHKLASTEKSISIYLETSAKTGTGVTPIFDYCVRRALEKINKTPQQRKCTIL